MLVLSGVSKSFLEDKNKLEILKDVTFEFKSNTSYAITGVSGVGKSTLVHLLAGIDTPTKGIILFENKNINTMSISAKEYFFNKNIGLVFQEACLIPELSVLENVMIKSMVFNNSNLKPKALHLLDKLGLGKKADSNPLSLSGGQQQKVAVLRAIFNKPDFILADEPTGNLDENSAQEICDLLLEYCNELKIGLIISSHDSLIANSMNYVLKLSNHKLNKINQ